MDQSMNWGDIVSIGALSLTIAINLATVAYMTGTFNARISFIEREVTKIEIDLKEMRAFVPALATIKAQLESLATTVNELRSLLKKEQNPNA